MLYIRTAGARKASHDQTGWEWEGSCHELAVGLVCRATPVGVAINPCARV